MSNCAASFMRRALELARQAEGRTRPNPAVGALLVRNGQIVGEGFHPQAGAPHAEIFALQAAGDSARGATLYVTLEPCCHTGRTAPCTEAIIAAGVQRVVAGSVDPNPRVAGAGFSRLRAAGIEVESGVLEDECRYLIAPFAKHIRTGLPHLTLKAALTLDGNIATANGQSQWITGAASRERAHRLRDRCDAVMVGIGTILADNPHLTTRLPEGGGRDALRIVVDSQLRTPPTAALFETASTAGVLIATTELAPTDRCRTLETSGAEVLRVPGSGVQVDLGQLLRILGERGLQSILLEGGGLLNHAAWHAGLIDRAIFCFAPFCLGGQGTPVFTGPGVANLAAGRRLERTRVERYGDDIWIEGEVDLCSPA